MKHPGRTYRIAVLLALLASPLAVAAWQEKPMEDADVEQLVDAGLAQELIVAKIEQADMAHFDLSTEALVRMKKRGIGDEILAAMLKRAGAPERARTTDGTRSSSPVVLRVREGQLPLTALGGSYDNSLVRALTGRSGQVRRFPGDRASVRTRDPRPILVIRFDHDPRNDYFLVRFASGGEDPVRQLPIGSGLFGAKGMNQPNNRVVIPCDATPESDDLWRLAPRKPLVPGEYGVYQDLLGQLFPFGVDAGGLPGAAATPH
jgi:hypothetical protein